MLFFVFLTMFAIGVWTAVRVLRQSDRNVLRIVYLIALAVVSLLAYWTTYQYEYFSNENTRICGWPVPTVIFQRDNLEATWDDFVGPTTILGLPMNLAIFMFIPSVIFLGLTYWKPRKFSTPIAEQN
jgi:TRAP-type C4-dicarboxylate transport system permease small subunit